MKRVIIFTLIILIANSLFSQSYDEDEDYDEGSNIGNCLDIGFHTTIVSKDPKLMTYGGHIGYYGSSQFGFALNVEFGGYEYKDAYVNINSRVASVGVDFNYLISNYFAIGSGVGLFHISTEMINALDQSATYLQIPLNLKVYLFKSVGFSLGYKLIVTNDFKLGALPNGLNLGLVVKIH